MNRGQASAVRTGLLLQDSPQRPRAIAIAAWKDDINESFSVPRAYRTKNDALISSSLVIASLTITVAPSPVKTLPTCWPNTPKTGERTSQARLPTPRCRPPAANTLQSAPRLRPATTA